MGKASISSVTAPSSEPLTSIVAPVARSSARSTASGDALRALRLSR
jgi:hypothetical protein